MLNPGPVVQLNRMSDSGSEGRGFESPRGHKKRIIAYDYPFLVYEHPPQASFILFLLLEA